jgi:hypothetical protein
VPAPSTSRSSSTGIYGELLQDQEFPGNASQLQGHDQQYQEQQGQDPHHLHKQQLESLQYGDQQQQQQQIQSLHDENQQQQQEKQQEERQEGLAPWQHNGIVKDHSKQDLLMQQQELLQQMRTQHQPQILQNRTQRLAQYPNSLDPFANSICPTPGSVVDGLYYYLTQLGETGLFSTFMICHSKGAIDPALQYVIKTTR